jgi:hypothetical protein
MTFMRRTDQGKEYDARSMSENLRDMDQALRRGIKWRARVYEALYTSPMWLGGLRSRPFCILLGNVQAINGPEVPIAGANGFVQFVWDGPEQGARITTLAGLTSGSQYRFSFLIAEGDV